MVERERDEGEAARALTSGPPPPPAPQEGAAEDEKGEDERGEEEEEDDDRDDEGVEWSEIRLAIEELSPPPPPPAGRRLKKHGGGDAKAAASSPPTLRFLALSHLLLRVLDKIGPTMAVLRLDVQRNIEMQPGSQGGTSLIRVGLLLSRADHTDTATVVRLQELYLLDPARYSTLTGVVEKEVKEGTARKVDSCARAVLWLARSMDFTIALLQSLEEDSEQPQQRSLAELVEAAYEVSLKPWHGWISSAACKIALKLIPERKVFTGLLLGMGQDCSALDDEIRRLALLLRPLLDDVHSMMVSAAAAAASDFIHFSSG